MRELGRALQEQVEGSLAIFMRPENMLRFKHGHRWSIRRVDASEDAGEFRSLQSLLPMSHEDVMRNDLGKLAQAMQSQAEALAQQSVDLILERVDEAVEQTGNKVIEASRRTLMNYPFTGQTQAAVYAAGHCCRGWWS